MTKRYLLLPTLLATGFSSPLLAQPVGPEFQVNTRTGGNQQIPSIASDAQGNFVVAWSSIQDGGYGVFARRYASDGHPLGGEFQVNTLISAEPKRVAVASDAKANFVVVWERSSFG